MNNVNKSEGDNSDFFGVNRSVLSPLPKLGTMGSNWGEVRVTGFLYHLNKGRRGFSTRTAQLIRACKFSKSHGLAVEATATIDTNQLGLSPVIAYLFNHSCP